MADNEETFDPNDLDSIDALLDEAEQSANDDIGDEASEAADPLDSLLDEAEAAETSEEEVSVEPESEDAAESEPVELEAAAKTVEQDKGAKKEAVPDADEFIAKRAEAARSDPMKNMVQNKDMAAADMDAIKKLIIIVGSVLSVLALTGIGIGVWGALAASSAGVDEDTLLVIESTQARAAENGVVALESGKAVKSLSIKIDSLSSLLEGLSADIAKIEAQSVLEQDQVVSTEHGKAANGYAAKTKSGYADSADMDAIKKLIIIVGSVLSVLALTGIGIGVWGALAASSAGVDEDTLLVIESTQARAAENGVVALESGKAVKSLSIKIDSLSSLLEGLSADIAKIEAQSVLEQDQVVSTEHGKAANGYAAKTKSGYADSALMDKVTSVNGKMIKAQRRIDEVNRRVKSIQQQYTALLHSVKTVEKQFVEQQAAIEAEKAAEEEKPKFSAEGYEYMPNGMSYDESVGDSYP